MPLPQSISEVDTLDQLQTPQQIELLDKIDELRNQGLGHHGISLPQLIVCGDQSSGKSSLLEGLTRLRFPTKEGQCTLFATEVVLRRDVDIEISCTIIPSKSRPHAVQRTLAIFQRTFTSSKDFPFQQVVDDARQEMAQGAQTDGKNVVYDDVLRIRYSGPDLPGLTIVDLPGMITSSLKGDDTPERIDELVTNYMSDEKSIILAVVQAGNDLENQKVLKRLESCDPKRFRTLGVITKPDKVERGGDEEKKLMKLLRNEVVPLKHRWHAVRNRSWTTREQSDAERDEIEKSFFAAGSWSSIPQENTGIAALRVKLSRVLLEHIGRELPSLVATIQRAHGVTETSLKAFGTARTTLRQQRTYLTGHAEEFQRLIHDALRGVYSNGFFKLSSPTERTPTRLRTEIQNLNIAFARIMYQKGHTWNISEETTGISKMTESINTAQRTSRVTQEYEAIFDEPSHISRNEFLRNHIGDCVRNSRPSGLPSLVNPWVIGEVFRQQSKPWRNIAEHHLQCTFRAMRKYIEEALGSSMDLRTCRMLILMQVQPELERRWKNVKVKLEELLLPYTEQDPITYDPSFIQELEETRAARYQVKTGVNASGAVLFGQGGNTPFTFGSSNEQLLTESVDDFTNSEILDLMQTYYKVSILIRSLIEVMLNISQRAITVFISNITVLAIENCLIKDLASVFSPSLIANMEDDKIQAIAAETEDVRIERNALVKRLAALEVGKQVLNEHIGMSSIRI
jgi:GTP-binding protein EngB required for normal cell division